MRISDYFPRRYGVGCGIMFCMHLTQAIADKHWAEHCKESKAYWDSWREKNGFDPDFGYQGTTEPLVKAGWLTEREAKKRKELRHE